MESTLDVGESDMSVTDEQVFHAMEVFREELKAWEIMPVPGSEWNDNGVLKYRQHMVTDMGRSRKILRHPPSRLSDRTVYTREVVGDRDSAHRFIHFKAMKAALLSVES